MNAEWMRALALAMCTVAAVGCGGSGGDGKGQQGSSSSSSSSSGGGSSSSSGSSSSGGASSSSSSSSGGSGLSTQAAYEWVPETCTTTGRSWTTAILMVAERTNYCKYVQDGKPLQDITCPDNGEKALQIVIGRSSLQSTVQRIGPGTYELPNAVATLLTGDGSTSCVSMGRPATSGSVTLTSTTGGYKGSYDFVIDGAHHAGTLDTQLCWSGEDVRGPCVDDPVDPGGTTTCSATLTGAATGTYPCSSDASAIWPGSGNSYIIVGGAKTTGGFSFLAELSGAPEVKTYSFTSAATSLDWGVSVTIMENGTPRLWSAGGGPSSTTRAGSLILTITSVEAPQGTGTVSYAIHGVATATLPLATGGASGSVILTMAF